MTESTSSQVSVRCASSEKAAEILAWLLDKPLAAAEQSQACPDGVFEARRADVRVGALWANILPGRVATLIGPKTIAPDSTQPATQLIDRANAYLRQQGIRVAQAILNIDQQPHHGWYTAAGYQHEILLDYLVCLVDKSDTTNCDHLAGGLQFERYKAEPGSRLQEVIERTYLDSLDCPVLNGKREPEDVLAGYTAIGEHSPSCWFVLTCDHQDVGCLLLTDHPGNDCWEIIYQGIVPEYRGRGFGLAATHHAQRLTKRAGRPRLTLAVDAANAPAQSVYARAGFIRWDRKLVMLRIN